MRRSKARACCVTFGNTMKRRLIQITITIATTAIAVVALHLSLIDGIGGLVWGALFKEDTMYAPGYTAWGWRTIRVGMPQADVFARIGHPLNEWTNEDGAVVMRWSRSPGDTHYRCRAINMKNKHVTGKWAEFYVD